MLIQNYHEIDNELSNNDYVVAFIFASYNLSYVKDIVDQYYHHWTQSHGDNLQLYWLGYGEYEMKQKGNIVCELMPANQERIYFNIELFNELKREFNEKVNFAYRDSFELVLFNVVKGKIDYNNHIRIVLEDILGDSQKTLRMMMSLIVENTNNGTRIENLKYDIKKYLAKERLQKVSWLDITEINK